MRRSLLKTATLAAILISALAAHLRLAGPSPIAWMDTFNDEIEVRRCVVGNSCTLTGVSTSIPGQVHAVAWLELRTLLTWLGIGINGTHLFLLFLNAVAVVLVFHLATQLGGQLAGAAAVWILMVHIVLSSVRSTALYNSTPLLFLGAVFVLACTAVVERPGVVSVALAALVGAVMANVHLACIMTGISVVWVALLAPRRRLFLAAFAGALFALATVSIAPPSWLHNLTSLLQHDEVSSRTTDAVIWPPNEIIPWALFAAGVWAVSLVCRSARWVAYRRRSQGAFAVMLPFLAAFLLGPRFGVDANAKYLAHVRAACAIAAALPFGLVAGALLRRVASRPLVGAAEGILPFAVAVAVALPAALNFWANGPTVDDQRTPTISDLVAVAHILRDEHGWDVARMLENLKTPYGAVVAAGLSQLSAGSNGPHPVAADVGSSALLMVLGADELPHPLPSNWKIVRGSSGLATVLVFMQSRLDWTSFAVCARQAGGGEQPCAESGWRFDDAAATFVVPHMPPAGLGWQGTLTLRVPLRPVAPGYTEAIFMPRLRDICGGQITSVSDGALAVDPDRRRATLSAGESDPASPSTLEIEWHLGAAECGAGAAGAYDGLPPFFIAGDAANVRLVETILRKREG